MAASFSFQNRIIAPDVTLWTFEGHPSDVQWGQMLEAATDWLVQLESRGCRTSVIVDPSGLKSAGPAIRRAAGEWRAHHMPLIANVVHNAGYVAERAWLRGAITAVFWFAPPVVPLTVCASRDEALAWVMSSRSKH